MTKQEVFEEATRRARAAMERALNCEPLVCPDQLVVIDLDISGIFDCCEPCRTGHCGQDCNHGARDQRAMTFSTFLDKRHDGCMCVLEGMRVSEPKP